MNDFNLRPAVQADQAVIRSLVKEGKINPIGLEWSRFWLAEHHGAVIGCCQVKPHQDGSRELASLVVDHEWRGKGVARALVEHFLEREPDPLYLMCAARLGEFYERFGFRTLEIEEMPAYFRRVSRFINAGKLAGRADLRVLIMVLERKFQKK